MFEENKISIGIVHGTASTNMDKNQSILHKYW
jgi:hypothetical protein